MDERILIIQTAFIGDAILTLPMIQKLTELNPSAKIDVVCNPSALNVFSSSPYVYRTIVLDKRGKQKSIIKLYKFASGLRSKNYSRIISPHRSFRTALLVLFLGVRDSTGFDNSSLKYVYKNLIKYKDSHHEVQRNMALIDLEYRNENWKLLPQMNSGSTIIEKVDNFIAPVKNENLVAVAPGAVWYTKRFPLENYRKVIEDLLGEGYSIILIGGKEDVELCSELSSFFKKSVLSAAGEFSISESVEILRRCRLLICNDSAPTHMAMAADIPTITIYCSTIPNFGFYPYNTNSSVISFDSLECKPCGIHGYQECPLGTFDCAQKIPVESIIKKVNEILV